MKHAIAIQVVMATVLTGLFSNVQATPTEFTMGRSVKYEQTGADSSYVALTDDNPYRYEVYVEEDSSTSVFSAGTITTPASNTESLSYDSDDESWSIELKTDSLDTLNSNCPTGTYTLDMTKVAGGTTEVTFDITSTDFPDAPVISDYSALQSIDSTSDLTISWSAWADGTSSDFIIIRIENSNGGTVYEINPGDTDALDGTATQVTIPAGTLSSGLSYTLEVQFIDIFSAEWTGGVSDYPDALKACYAGAQTEMTIKTSGTASLGDILTFALWNTTGWTIGSASGEVSPGTTALSSGSIGETISFNIAADSPISASLVTFTGPEGSSLSGTAAQQINTFTVDDSVVAYSYQVQNLTPYLPNGDYSVDYDGTTYSGTIDDAPAASDVIFFVPTLTLDDGVITNISWATYDSDYVSKDISSYSGNIQVQLQDSSYNSIYGNYDISPSTTSLDVSSLEISVGDVRDIVFFYSYDAGSAGYTNQFSTSYLISYEPNIFASLDHYDSWIPPYAATQDSFGWITDLFYPWIYSASADILANGSYQGDGKGWLYVYPDGASLSDGFYIYRNATGTWAWTNYYWKGWIYDYANGWVDITP